MTEFTLENKLMASKTQWKYRYEFPEKYMPIKSFIIVKHMNQIIS